MDLRETESFRFTPLEDTDHGWATLWSSVGLAGRPVSRVSLFRKLAEYGNGDRPCVSTLDVDLARSVSRAVVAGS